MRVLLLNFEGGPGAPLLNFERSPGSLGQGSRGPKSWGPGPTFTPCRYSENLGPLSNICDGVFLRE